MLSNKVIWSEGLFLRPQHFQQEQRYLETLVERRATASDTLAWGFEHLELDADLLRRGAVGIKAARGILPDGTPFSIPDDAPAPRPVEIAESLRDVRIFLALPQKRAGVPELDMEGRPAERRFLAGEVVLRDATTTADAAEPVLVARHNFSLLPDTEPHGAFSVLACAEVLERRPDGRVVLAEPAQFVPPVLDVAADATLTDYLSDVASLVRARAEVLAARLAQPSAQGVSEIGDLLLLQLCNRWTPFLAHLPHGGRLHPEALYALFLQLAGELGTYNGASRLAAMFEPYRHDALAQAFAPVVAEIRRVLTGVIEQTAVPIPLQPHPSAKGAYYGQIADPSLLQNAQFVLSVGAAMPGERIRTTFPQQVKIGSPDVLLSLVQSQIPGIEVAPLPVAPRQIPFHAAHVYFDLNRQSEYFKRLAAQRVIALHIPANFPDLHLALWAIRQR